MLTNRCISIPLVVLAASGPSLGQWSDDPAVNTLVSGGESGCVITHTVSAPGGDVWVAWYDSSSGYDILLQRLDLEGVAVFDPPILVSDQSLSWVQDFDLACDIEGRAALAWAGASFVGAALVGTDGTVMWTHEFGAGSGGFFGSAQVCGTDDGAVVVGWLQDAPSHFQRVEATGQLSWLGEVVIDAGGTTAVSDVKPAPGGGVVASFVHYLTFQGAKRLKAQRLSAGGASLWGSAPVDVFSSGSLQFGAYPEFIPDGQGGGVFSWYESSPLMSRIQWMTASGGQRWGSSGVPVTTESDMVHVAPSVCLDPASGESTVFWIRQNSTQSSAGVQANRFDEDGTPLWGGQGLQIAAPSQTASVFDLQAGTLGAAATAMWVSDPQLGDPAVVGVALNGEGTMLWGAAPTILAEGGEDTQSLSVTGTPGQRIAAWCDDRDGASRVYAQNVHEDGSLGPGTPCPADISGDGLVGADDLLAVIAGWGPCAGCPADLTGDGEVGTDDLLMVLAAWGSC